MTPIPWQVAVYGAGLRKMIRRGPLRIANMTTAARSGDAEFICRAVNAHDELLAALSECIAALSASPCTCNDDRDCQRCFANRKAHAAIAKGETTAAAYRIWANEIKP